MSKLYVFNDIYVVQVDRVIEDQSEIVRIFE